MSLTAILASFAVVVIQTVGGALWWQMLRQSRTTGVELLGMGIAVGTVTSLIAALVLKPTVVGPVAWALPTFFAVGAWVVIGRRRRTELNQSTSRAAPTGEWAAVVIGLGLGLIPLVLNWTRVPLARATDSSFTDLYFQQSLANGLARFGNDESLLMAGGSIRYHWFAFAWAGELDSLANLPQFGGLTRVLPVMSLLGVSAIAARWASTLAPDTRYARLVPTVAVILVVAGNYTGALYGSILNFDSPNQTLTSLWLLSLLFAVVCYINTGRVSLLVVVGLLAAASTGGKVSHIAVAAGGMGLLVTIGVVTRRTWWKRSLTVAAVSGAFALITYVVVIRGAAVDRNLVEEVAVKASTWQGLDPLPGTWGVLAGTVALILAALARLVGIGWLVRERHGRTDPSVLLSLGGLSVGILALITLRDGINENWFLLAASAPASVVSAVGFVGAIAFLRDNFERRGLTKAAVLAVLVSLPALILSTNGFASEVRPFTHWGAAWLPWVVSIVGAVLLSSGGSLMGETARSRGLMAFALVIVSLVASSVITRPTAWWTSQRQVFTEVSAVVPEAFQAPTSTPEGQTSSNLPSRVEVAAYLKETAGPDDIVFTTNTESAFIPAYTNLRTFLSGARYQFGLGDAGDVGLLRDRQAIVDAVVATPARIDELLCPEGVDWIWWEGDVPESLADSIELRGQGVTLVRLKDECADA